MFRSWLLRLTLLLGCGVASLHWVSASPHQQTLQSFYIARFVFSDYIPAWSDSILDVSPEGDGVRVRLIRISQANDYCPGLVVRAVEHTFPRTSVQGVAGIDMCAFTPGRVTAALKKARSFGDNSDSAAETVVATCSARQKEFDFPSPVEVDQQRLNQSDPDISNLWETYHRIFQQAFGESLSFNSLTPEQEKQMEELGTRLLPELKSGKYQRAYMGSKCGRGQVCDNYLAWRLRGYDEAPQPYDPATATLLDADALHLIKYVPPIVPRLAILARIFGDVHLRILVEPETGAVKNVEALSGHPLLSDTSMTAARSWRFDPEALPGPSVEATLHFQFRCR